MNKKEEIQEDGSVLNLKNNSSDEALLDLSNSVNDNEIENSQDKVSEIDKEKEEFAFSEDVVVSHTSRMKFWFIINIVLIIVLAILTIFVYFIFFKNNQDVEVKSIITNKNIDIEEVAKAKTRVIDGVFVEEGKENIMPVAVMIDNHIDARPPSGLSKANHVIEAEAEGGITRYMAIYANDEDIEKIGPVRSARPYFIDWAHEFSAIYAHCGGSPEALVKISKDGIVDLNEFYNEHYFWRDQNEKAPHNIYTSSEELNDFRKIQKIDEGKYLGWIYKDKEKEISNRPEESAISIKYSLIDYEVEWHYKKDTNNYVRYLAGEVHADSDGSIITAKNLVIQYIDSKVLDDKLRLKMDIIGEGDATVCFDGECFEAEWKKSNSVARTRFYDNENNEIEFNRGLTWVNVVKPDYEVEVN